MSLVKCPECGQMVSDKSPNCIHCGAPIEKKSFCPECGSEIPQGSRNCPGCGCPNPKYTAPSLNRDESVTMSSSTQQIPPSSTNAKDIGVSEEGNKEKVRQFLAIHGDKFPSSKRFEIESLLTNSSNDSIAIAQGLSYKKSSTTLVLAIFDFDRFYLGQIGTGILKFITAGGIWIWWIIDLCHAKSRTKKYNYKLLVKKLQGFRN